MRVLEVLKDMAAKTESALGIARAFGPTREVASAEYSSSGHLAYDRFVAASRELLQMEPCSYDSTKAQSAATYRLRRMAPTLAAEAPLPSTEQASVGNWIGQIGDTSQSLTSKARSMPVRYNDLRTQLAARVKSKLVLAMRMAAE
eukprot:11793525-Karenia_brevis.AAC.1